jgi:ArsR family transcriptional regulator
VLELLVEQPRPVQELLRELKIEPSNLSQQLAVLRRAGLVTVTRQGTSAVYAVSTPQVGALLAAGRQILAAVLRDTENLLAELRETS